MFAKSLDGTKSVLRILRQDIARKLGLRLMPVFDGANPIIELDLVDPAGNRITEVSVTPAGSESYNEALFDFVESNDKQLIDYRLLLSVCDRWCRWARFLSWATLGLLSLEGCISGILLWAYFASHFFSPRFLFGTFCPTGACIIGCITPLFFLLSAHDKINDFRKQYALP